MTYKLRMEVVLVIAVLVIVFVAIDALGRNSSSKQPRQSPVRLTELTTTQRAEVTEQVNSGQKIKAIKTLRSATGMSLEDAKHAIDTWDPHRHDGLTPDQETNRDPRLALPAGVVSEIDNLIANGKKIQAIKILRGETGLGLAEAKQAIDNWGNR